MKIYLIRHGSTDWNSRGILQGRENVPLNADGLRQAERCGEYLKNADFTYVISSPLDRALKTAEIIARHKNTEVTGVYPSLTERDYGKLSGKKPLDIFFPEEEGNDMEPIGVIGDRMLSALRDFAGKTNGENFAAVSHGGSINALLHKLSGGAIGAGKTRLKNTCVSILDYTDGVFSVVSYNMDAKDVH